jgi:transcriptional regulator with XRE-family HTH domain
MAKRIQAEDVAVGRRVKAARLAAGLSQEMVGDHLGLTFQQIQKYENGKNRVGPSRLVRMAKLFNVPVSYFFAGIESGKGGEDLGAAIIAVSHGAELSRAFIKIGDVSKRKLVVEFAQALAA